MSSQSDYQHYDRTHSLCRTPDSLKDFAALLKAEHRVPRTTLNYLTYSKNLYDPMGKAPLGNLYVDEEDASLYGWGANDILSHSDMRTSVFYQIKSWYDNFFHVKACLY